MSLTEVGEHPPGERPKGPRPSALVWRLTLLGLFFIGVPAWLVAEDGSEVSVIRLMVTVSAYLLTVAAQLRNVDPSDTRARILAFLDVFGVGCLGTAGIWAVIHYTGTVGLIFGLVIGNVCTVLSLTKAFMRS